jgi:DNA-binding transcriptional LysR family regulator
LEERHVTRAAKRCFLSQPAMSRSLERIRDLVVTLPRKLAKAIAAMANLRSVEPPPEIKNFQYFMVWHPRLTAEPAQVWFREQLRIVAKKI